MRSQWCVYRVATCKEQKTYDDGKQNKESDDDKRLCFMRGLSNSNSPTFSVAVVTCSLAKQLLQEHL